MKNLNLKHVLVSLAVPVGLATAAGAFVLLSPTRSWDSAPTYIIDNRGVGSVTDADGGVDATVDAINSQGAWNGAGSGTVVQAVAGSVASFQLGDGTPMLNFRDPINACNGNCLAATFTGYFSARGDGSYRIDDADIVTNTSVQWTSARETGGCSNEFFIEGVQVHEIGHGLGLGHTNVNGATMFPSVSACNNSPATTAADDEAGINALYDVGGGGGGGGGGGNTPPCDGCQEYNGSLSGTGDVEYEPNGTYYFSSRSGAHRGVLVGPSGADFDLRLYKWNRGWRVVARSEGSTSTEVIDYNGSRGYYLWRVRSYSGSGSYDFFLKRP